MSNSLQEEQVEKVNLVEDWMKDIEGEINFIFKELSNFTISKEPMVNSLKKINQISRLAIEEINNGD